MLTAATHPAVANGSYDVGRIREDFPILACRSTASPSSISTCASAARTPGMLDRLEHAYTAEYPTCIAASLSRQCGRPKLRGCGVKCRRSQCARAKRRSSSPATPPSDQSRRLYVRPRAHPRPATRSCSRSWSIIHIVPRHFLRERQGAVIKWAPVDDDGNFLLDELDEAAHAAQPRWSPSPICRTCSAPSCR